MAFPRHRFSLLFAQPPLSSRDRGIMIAALAGVIFLATGPSWLSYYAQGAVRDALIFAIFALSFDLLWGKSNTLTLGHATYFGLGAYGYAITATKLDWSAFPAILSALGVAGAFAAAIGYFLIFAGVRLHFLAVMSIAILLIVAHLAVSWSWLTGGDVGLLGIPGLRFEVAGLEWAVRGADQTYFFALSLLSLVFMLLWLACRGNYGKVLAAIGMNEMRARTFGHHTSLHLLVVFVASAMIAALSGAVYAAFSGVVGPDLFSVIFSMEVVLWVAIGGRGTLIGPVVATILLTRIQQEVSSYSTSLWPLVLGFLFLLVILFFPGGIQQVVGKLASAASGLRARRTELQP